MKKDASYGLSTYDALGILHNEIDTLLSSNVSISKCKWSDVKKLFSHSNEHSTVSGISLSFLYILAFSLIFVSFVTTAPLERHLFVEGIVVLFIGVGNTLLALWDDRLRLEEVPEKINNLLLFIKECQEKCIWEPENYPHLCCPYSPCITLQWTYRDHKLVNLPWALLVRGDTILLRPGQPSPAAALPQECGGAPLACGEVYSPPEKHNNISQPTARIPLPNKRFILQETPILRNMKEALEKSARCPVTCYDKQRYLLVTKVSFNLILPLLLIVVFLISTLHYTYLPGSETSGHWATLLVVRPASIALPLLPLALPTVWLALNTIGYARMSAYLQSSCSTKVELMSEDPFEEISIHDDGEEDVVGLESGIQWCQHLLHTLFGKQHCLSLIRTVNPLHILGSVTALCCVDKKGILSWPNPTAEKVFFLRTASTKPNAPSEIGQNDGDMDLLDIDDHTDDADEDCFEDIIRQDKPEERISSDSGSCTVAEVLDLTHDTQSPFKLQFDDKRWQEHLGSLKPIGLAILLNTCNMQTHERYLQFCSHVTCEALYNEDLIPVTNRSSKGFKCLSCVKEVSTLLSNNKCLCELPKQIGFTDDVTKNFKLLEQLSTFRHVQAETVRRDIRFARSLALATKLKLPFPHMVSVVTSEVAIPKSLQLFSQATGDIALDSCVDFWDGNTLRILTPSDRKKVLDFYQRTSLTAYCTAFAYRPLNRNVDHSLSSVYMELPPDSHALYLSNRSPTPVNPNLLSQSIDSLFGGELYDDDVTDINGCFEIQCNQIFLGMVTMQYQAQSEMVQLIEQLERACIRFVHFSKENELRSRVFSEKMGLESGWNCHISLLSSEPTMEQTTISCDDKGDNEHAQETPLLGPNPPPKRGSLEGSRNMSVSAPCAINLDVEKGMKDSKSNEGDNDGSNAFQDGWQSLSCLTDSTEQSVPIYIDNRAKLPRGIEHIRPHLEKVDNVPLLVSLFTDCTPSTTCQMIGIRQEYGEVVLVLGSSANADNSAIFLKANASIAMEPLYPQVCQKVSVFRGREDCVMPSHLGQRLNSLPCTVSITRQHPVSLFHLIMHSRHYMQSLWSSIQFWVCCCIGISILQVVSSFLLTPPILSVGLVLWLCCLIVPVLSVSLVFCPTSTKVMNRPGNKFQSSITYETGLFVAWCYGSKFLLTIFTVPLVYLLALSGNCFKGLPSNVTSACPPHFPPQSVATSWPNLDTYLLTVSAAQHLASTFLVIQLVTISISFVYRDKLCWKKSPLHNKVWCTVSVIILLTEVSLLLIMFLPSEFILPWSSVLVGVVSPFLVFLFNETVKWQEIKANVRNEKRARLEFGTKLGMNSPF